MQPINHKKRFQIFMKLKFLRFKPILYLRLYFLHVKFVNILKYSNNKTVLHLQNINLLWNLNSEYTGRVATYGYTGLY